MKKASVRELKSRMSEYLRAVEKGDEIIITKRGKEIALIIPLRHESLRSKFISLLADGTATWKGGKPSGLSTRVKTKGKPLSRCIIEERR